MLLSIRSRLLALVVATVIPFTILVGAGLWSQWQSDQAAAIQQAIGEARVLAAQIDDHIGDIENLLTGLSEAVSTDPGDVEANDALLERVRSQLPDYIAHISIFSPDGNSIGASGVRHLDVTGRTFLTRALAGESLRSAM